VEHIPPRRGPRGQFIDTDVVPRILLEEREQEVLAKDEMIKVSWTLNAGVLHVHLYGTMSPVSLGSQLSPLVFMVLCNPCHSDFKILNILI